MLPPDPASPAIVMRRWYEWDVRFLVVALAMCAVVGLSPKAEQPPKKDRILDADTVDLRGVWNGKSLDPKKAKESGIDLARFQSPRKVRDSAPHYPREAQANGITGTVVLDCIIGTDGKPFDCHALTAHKLLREAAVDAVTRWVFEPLRVDGTARKAVVTITVRFSLP
jgi:TonB family protein